MSMDKGLFLALETGAVSVPSLLLQWYARLGLTEVDMMLLIHLMAFREKEKNDLPAVEDLQARMSADPEEIAASLEKLVSEEWIAIKETVDPETGLPYESYDISGVYERLAAVVAEWARQEERESAFGREDAPGRGQRGDAAGSEEGPEGTAGSGAGFGRPEGGRNLFSLFEQEFGRPLTPMEIETINGWLDKDRYPEPLIEAALKEAVYAGKLHFRYIDRMLLDWARNRIRTPEEAKEYATRFRGGFV
jgi:DNA replication protein